MAETDGTIDAIYSILKCTLFDIATRKIGEHYYDIYCDDEGLLKDKPMVSAMSPDNQPMLVGNLFIVKHNDEGDAVSLTDEEIKEIQRNLTPIFDEDGRYYPCLICDY